MNHVELTALCKGDEITAISTTLKAAKAIEDNIFLSFGAYGITVRPTSDEIDLAIILNHEKAKWKRIQDGK